MITTSSSFVTASEEFRANGYGVSIISVKRSILPHLRPAGSRTLRTSRSLLPRCMRTRTPRTQCTPAVASVAIQLCSDCGNVGNFRYHWRHNLHFPSSEENRHKIMNLAVWGPSWNRINNQQLYTPPPEFVRNFYGQVYTYNMLRTRNWDLAIFYSFGNIPWRYYWEWPQKRQCFCRQTAWMSRWFPTRECSLSRFMFYSSWLLENCHQKT